MKVTSVQVEESKLTAKIDLELEKLPLSKTQKKTLKSDIGDYVKEQVLLSVASSKSPVTGRNFPKLSKEYKKEKDESGYSPIPNLERTGDLMNAVDYEINAEGIEFGVFGPEAPKADGHNNLSGDSKLPERRFIPDEGQSFSKEILGGVDRIIADAIAEGTEVDLRDINSKKELWSYLKETFSGFTKAEILSTISRNVVLKESLEEVEDWLE